MSINKDMWQKPSQKDLKAIIKDGLRDEPYDFPENNIDGVSVFMKHFDFSPCIHIRIGFRYGAIHDDAGKEGTAHFLEHMIFDGSDIFDDEKDTQEFGKTILLDSLNAYTGLFELFMTGKTLPHNFDIALAGMFSMLAKPKLTKKSWAHEQKVITQEAWGRFLNEKRIAYLKKEKANTLYDLPDRLRTGSALGWPETVLAITHDDIVHAHKKFFVKENMEIYLAGNLSALGSTKDLAEKIKSFIDMMPNGEKSKLPYIPHKIGAPIIPVFDHTYDEVGLAPRQQTSINMDTLLPRFTRNGPNISTEEKKHIATLTLASELLSDLVFRKLRLENSWCYGASAGIYIATDYHSFSIGSSIDLKHVDEAIAIIWGIVDDVKKGEFKSDFQKTKYLVIENSIARERTTNGILDRVIEGIKTNGEIPLLRDLLEEISEVTFEDVQSVVSTYLDKDIVFTEIIRPSSDTLATLALSRDGVAEVEGGEEV